MRASSGGCRMVLGHHRLPPESVRPRLAVCLGSGLFDCHRDLDFTVSCQRMTNWSRSTAGRRRRCRCSSRRPRPRRRSSLRIARELIQQGLWLKKLEWSRASLSTDPSGCRRVVSGSEYVVPQYSWEVIGCFLSRDDWAEVDRDIHVTVAQPSRVMIGIETDHRPSRESNAPVREA
jgi:hypothetical protein